MEINVDTLLYWAGAIITLSAACTVITGVISKKFKVATKQIVDDAMATFSADIDKKLESVNKQIAELSSSTSSASAQTQEALKCLIRATINDAYKKYYEEEHSIDLHTLESLENLFEIYTALGGNHFIENQMKQLRTLIQ